jgi:hypothetical protein
MNKKKRLKVFALIILFLFLIAFIFERKISYDLDQDMKNNSISSNYNRQEVTQNPFYQKLSPTIKLTTPAPSNFESFLRQEGKWKYYISPVGFTFKSPNNWFTQVYSTENEFLLNHQDYLPAVAIYPDGEHVDDMPGNYEYLEIFYPIKISGKHFDIGKDYENGLQGLQEKNPGSYLTSINNKHTLAVFHKPDKQPEGVQGDWSNQYSQTYYIDFTGDRILTIVYYFDSLNEPNAKVFEEIVKSINFE